MKQKKRWLMLGLIMSVIVIASIAYNQIKSAHIYQTEVLPYETKYQTHMNNEYYGKAYEIIKQLIEDDELFKTVPKSKRGNILYLPYL